MEIASLPEIRKELKHTDPDQLYALCLRMASFKKENKELLHYLLFEAQYNEVYVDKIKGEIDDLFNEMNQTNLYWIKKSARKILKIITKHSKFMKDKESELELLLHFCSCLKALPINLMSSIALYNLYTRQLKKMNGLIGSLHEDLQYDYQSQIETLQL